MTTLRSISGNGVLVAAQSSVSPRMIDANAFGELSDAPNPEPGHLIGWDDDGLLANIGHVLGVYTSVTIPEPVAGSVGMRIIVKDTDEPSYYAVCLENSEGGFEWVTLAQSS